MSDQDHRGNPSDQDDDSFYGNDKPSIKQSKNGEHQIITKSDMHKKKKLIRKKKQKSSSVMSRSYSVKEKEKLAKLNSYAEKKAEAIIEQMNKKYEKDLQLYKKKQMACKKLVYLDELAKELKNVYICNKFLENNGLVQFEKWLSKVHLDGGESVEPSIALRKGIFEILSNLNIKNQQLVRAQELQRIIQKNKRSQTKQLRDLCQKISLKWTHNNYEDEQAE